MRCTHVQDWLLEAAEPKAPPVAIAEHLAGCPACHEVAAQIEQLETDWRALPLPVSLEGAKQRVLDRSLVEPLPSSKSPKSRRANGGRLVRWALAAAALLLVGVGMYFVLFSSSAQASPDVFDRLVDWNVALTEAPATDRERIYQASTGELHNAAAASDLSAEDADLIQALLDNADRMTKNADPVAEAERLSAIADKLLLRIQRTVKNGKDAKLAKFARHYGKVDRAIQDSLEDAELDDSVADAQQQRLLTLSQHEQDRHNSLTAVIAAAPAAEQQVIRSALEQPARKNRKHKKKH